MKEINTEEELGVYNLENKWNDYIGVQKEVLRGSEKRTFLLMV